MGGITPTFTLTWVYYPFSSKRPLDHVQHR